MAGSRLTCVSVAGLAFGPRSIGLLRAFPSTHIQLPGSPEGSHSPAHPLPRDLSSVLALRESGML